MLKKELEALRVEMAGFHESLSNPIKSIFTLIPTTQNQMAGVAQNVQRKHQVMNDELQKLQSAFDEELQERAQKHTSAGKGNQAEERAQKETRTRAAAHLKATRTHVDDAVRTHAEKEAKKVVESKQKTQREFDEKAPIRRAAELKKYQDAVAAEQEEMEANQKKNLQGSI